MKTQKLLVIVGIVCLLVGASGAAMARNDCPEGAITGGVFDEIVITEFESCTIVGVVVTERIRVVRADEIIVANSSVRGGLRVLNTRTVTLVGNIVSGGNLVAKGNLNASVANNVVDGGSIVVSDDIEGGVFEQDQIAIVQGNAVTNGNLRVNGNERAEVKSNATTDGDITCTANDHLDSHDNDARRGKVDCSRSLDFD